MIFTQQIFTLNFYSILNTILWTLRGKVVKEKPAIEITQKAIYVPRARSTEESKGSETGKVKEGFVGNMGF